MVSIHVGKLKRMLKNECFRGAGAHSLLRAPLGRRANPNDSFDGIVYSNNYQYELKYLQ
jgi:hypothetical protein